MMTLGLELDTTDSDKVPSVDLIVPNAEHTTKAVLAANPRDHRLRQVKRALDTPTSKEYRQSPIANRQSPIASRQSPVASRLQVSGVHPRLHQDRRRALVDGVDHAALPPAGIGVLAPLSHQAGPSGRGSPTDR